MMHRMFAAFLSIVLVQHVRGFNNVPLAPVQRAPQVQPQNQPGRPQANPYYVPRTPGRAFMQQADPALSAVPPAAETMALEPEAGPTAEQEYAWAASQWQPVEEEMGPPEARAEGVSLAPFAAGIFGFFSAAFLTFRSRIFLQPSAASQSTVEMYQGRLVANYETSRRQVVQAGAAAAVAAPLVQGTPAQAGMDRSARAPVITIFDHRGCQRGADNTEYTGVMVGDQDDEMCVKVESLKVNVSDARAATQLAEAISFKAKGIDGRYTGKYNTKGLTFSFDDKLALRGPGMSEEKPVTTDSANTRPVGGPKGTKNYAVGRAPEKNKF